MVKKLAQLTRLPVYPYLVAMFPVLYVFSQNIGLTNVATVWLPLLIVLILTSVTWALFHKIFKDKHKSGILAAILMLMTLTYGQLYAATDQVLLFGYELHKHRYIMAACILTFILVSWVLKSVSRSSAAKFGKMAGVGSLLLFLMPTITLLASYQQSENSTHPDQANFIEKYKQATDTSAVAPPDVYYFILDGYGREDILRDRLGFDNSVFISELEKRGFYVAKKSHSNYSQSLLSITSSLSMNYLQELAPPSEHTVSMLHSILKHNSVVNNFKRLGYKTVNNNSGYDFTRIVSTDLTLSPDFSFTELDNAVYANSVVPYLFNNDFTVKSITSGKLGFIQSYMYEQHREKVKMGLTEPRTLQIDSKKPVMAFIHVLLAHPPFVFDSSGAPVTPNAPFSLVLTHKFTDKKAYTDYFTKGYTNQVIYGNKELLKTIDAIQKRKGRQSVIILQGDHGPWTKPSYDDMDAAGYSQRMSILNAMYFPDSEAHRGLYPEISPVNTFRFVFNHYFGANYTLLPDKMFYSAYEQRFNYYDVTDTIK